MNLIITKLENAGQVNGDHLFIRITEKGVDLETASKYNFVKAWFLNLFGYKSHRSLINELNYGDQKEGFATHLYGHIADLVRDHKFTPEKLTSLRAAMKNLHQRLFNGFTPNSLTQARDRIFRDPIAVYTTSLPIPIPRSPSIATTEPSTPNSLLSSMTDRERSEFSQKDLETLENSLDENMSPDLIRQHIDRALEKRAEHMRLGRLLHDLRYASAPVQTLPKTAPIARKTLKSWDAAEIATPITNQDGTLAGHRLRVDNGSIYQAAEVSNPSAMGLIENYF